MATVRTCLWDKWTFPDADSGCHLVAAGVDHGDSVRPRVRHVNLLAVRGNEELYRSSAYPWSSNHLKTGSVHHRDTVRDRIGDVEPLAIRSDDHHRRRWHW